MGSKFIGPKSSKKTFYAAGTVALGLFAFNYIPDTFGQDYYQKFIQCYRNGVPVPVSEKVMKRLSRATDLCKFEDYQKALVKPFSVFGFDVSIGGSTQSRFGALVGIPANYEYESTNDIQRSEIRFRDKEINWESESGKFLEESLVLTEDEQVFGLCKALMQLNTHYVLLNSLFPSVSFVTVYTVGNYLNTSLGLLAKPFSVRLVMYCILGLFGAGTWCFMKDFNQVRYDTEIDKQLCALGPRYVQAGFDYYDKQLKKNMALRKLLNDNTFTAKGNVNYTLRQESLPITLRKSYFESQLGGVAAQ